MSGGPVPPSRDDESQDALQRLCLADPVWTERYQGWTELGHGGSATVVRTHSLVAGQDIAVKVFTRTAPEEWARFQQEVRNAQALAAPSIVRTYSPFRRGSLAWIEMELVEGEDLRRALRRRSREGRPFSLEEATGIARALAEALRTAHEAGVVHRDVKPANVLLPRSGSPAAKLGDFGTSRLTGSARLTHTGLLAGTPQFCAPEAVQQGDVGPPADVYSFSLCLYLLLSNGRFPFALGEDDPPARWLRAQTDEAPLPIGRLREELPEGIADLLARGLDKDPARRPTARDVVAVLDAGGAARLPDTPRRRRVPWAVIAGAAALAAGGLAAWMAGREPPVRMPAQAAAPPVPSPPPSPLPSPAASASAIATAPPSPGSVRPPTAPDVSASLQGLVLTLRNGGTTRLEDLLVTVTAADGTRHEALVRDGLGGGEELFVALEDFSPPAAAGAVGSGSEVSLRERSGARRTVAVRLR